ncbi:MAG: hypothetical protein GF355_00565 [Candidatus Eisenbacteria bacterium]|nr:hypothetical protein [Candidatus Eisenbacteria bacterium]
MRTTPVGRCGRLGLGLALVLLVVQGAAATEVGIRYGHGDLRGSRLFPGSGDLGGTKLMGLQLLLDTLPLIDVEVAGEFYEEEFDFHDAILGGEIARGEGTLSDLALLATGKIGLPLPFLPLGSAYAGLGLGAHFVDLDLEAEPEDGGKADEVEDAVEDAVRDIAGEETEVEWHGVLGVKFGLLVLPINIFAEARYQDVTGEKAPDLASAYVGLNLRFE